MPHVIIRIWELTAKKYATRERGHISLAVTNRENNLPDMYISYRPAESYGILAGFARFLSTFIHKQTCFNLAEDQALEGGMWRKPTEVHLETLPHPETICDLWSHFKVNGDFSTLDADFFRDLNTHHSFALSVFLLQKAGLDELTRQEITTPPSNDPTLRRTIIPVGAALGYLGSLSSIRIIDALTREFEPGTDIVEILQNAEDVDRQRRITPNLTAHIPPPTGTAFNTSLVSGTAQMVIVNGDVTIIGQQNTAGVTTSSPVP